MIPSSTSILYVEDNFDSRIVMRILLEQLAGLEHVTIFETSEQFLERVAGITPPPDLVLLDIHVNPIDGYEMLRQLRGSGQFKDTPIVALTASVMSEEVHELRMAGFNGVLAKPINQDNLLQSLQRVLLGQEVWEIQ